MSQGRSGRQAEFECFFYWLVFASRRRKTPAMVSGGFIRDVMASVPGLTNDFIKLPTVF